MQNRAELLPSRLRGFRLRRGLSKASLARASGLSESSIHRYETDEAVEPSLGSACRLANALGIPLQLLVSSEQALPLEDALLSALESVSELTPAEESVCQMLRRRRLEQPGPRRYGGG